jgi:1,4-dihydroxy-6-naphthoate synthase
MKLTLGFSPCPNDTFIFDALVNKKIETGGFDFEPFLEDVETLNQWALQGRLDLTKISYGVLPLLMEQYELLDAGGALGKGVGPLLITRSGSDLIDDPNPGAGELLTGESRINACRVAIPGMHTTAHLLFSLAYPHAHHKTFMVFSGIEEAVLSGQVDCGVIIHENRFTYRQKGLVKLLDLGEFWEAKTGGPIPLGGIVLKRGHDATLHRQVNELIKKSLEYAFRQYPALPDFVKQHAQEMDEQVMQQHIDLYVNDYSLALGNEGKKAVQTLINIAASLRPQPAG